MKSIINPHGLFIARPQPAAALKPADIITSNKTQRLPFVAYPGNTTAEPVLHAIPQVILQQGLFIAYPSTTLNMGTDGSKKQMIWKQSYFSPPQNTKSTSTVANARKGGKSKLIFMHFIQYFKKQVC